MKKLIIAVLFLSLTANAEAQSFHWKNWKKHILCMCIGIEGPVGLGNK